MAPLQFLVELSKIRPMKNSTPTRFYFQVLNSARIAWSLVIAVDEDDAKRKIAREYGAYTAERSTYRNDGAVR